MRFKIDWASLSVGGKFTVFALFYFVFEGNLQVQAPPPGWGLYLEGLIHGGAYFRNFWVCPEMHASLAQKLPEGS